jgi:hypothetical protein
VHLLLKGPPARHFARWAAGGFLILWLSGWYEGETFALKALLAADTPNFARAFLVVWLVGWTIGGLMAAAFAVTCFWWRREERLLVEGTQLVSTPASLWDGLHGCRRRNWFSALRHLVTVRSLVLPRAGITTIEMARMDRDDSRPALGVRCGGRAYWLGTGLAGIQNQLSK